jgi:hypothetical protein
MIDTLNPDSYALVSLSVINRIKRLFPRIVTLAVFIPPSHGSQHKGIPKIAEALELVPVIIVIKVIT